jgi:hypothetical protein
MEPARGACTKIQANGLLDGCGEFCADPAKPRFCEACLCHQSFHPPCGKEEPTAAQESKLSTPVSEVASVAEGGTKGLAAVGVEGSNAAKAAGSNDNSAGIEGAAAFGLVTSEEPNDIVQRSPRLAAAAPHAGVKRASVEPQSLATKFLRTDAGSFAGLAAATPVVLGPFNAKFAQIKEEHGKGKFELIKINSVKNPWRIKCVAYQVDVACGPHNFLSNFDKHLQTLKHHDAIREKEEKAKEEATKLANQNIESEERQEAWLKKWALEGELIVL